MGYVIRMLETVTKRSGAARCGFPDRFFMRTVVTAVPFLPPGKQIVKPVFIDVRLPLILRKQDLIYG